MISFWAMYKRLISRECSSLQDKFETVNYAKICSWVSSPWYWSYCLKLCKSNSSSQNDYLNIVKKLSWLFFRGFLFFRLTFLGFSNSPQNLTFKAFYSHNLPLSLLLVFYPLFPWFTNLWMCSSFFCSLNCRKLDTELYVICSLAKSQSWSPFMFLFS